MTLITTGFDVEGSFLLHLAGFVGEIQTELNATRPAEAALEIHFYSQRLPENFPAVTAIIGQGAGESGLRRVTRVQVNLFARTDEPSQPADWLLVLLRDTLMAKLGFSSKKVKWQTYFDARGWYADQVSPRRLQRPRLEPADPGGWVPIQDEERPEISGLTRDFNIFYK
jgi:hypothetical protein